MVHRTKASDLVIDFIWSSLCPNVSACREVIDAATTQFPDRSMAVNEWQIETKLPAHCEGYGSPTILINGIDVAGVKPNAFNDCCRVYATMYEIRSVPLVEEVICAIEFALTGSIESID
ncbi:MAG: hypothetical protein ACPGQS_15465 [Bradymonadia bacterium]